MTEYLDPTDSVAVPRKTATRLRASTQGHHAARHLEGAGQSPARPSRGAPARAGDAKAIIRKKKPTFARPAPDALRREIVGATDVIVEGLAD